MQMALFVRPSELLCFSSFACHFELQTAECLCHFIFVSVCVVTNHTRNHDRIAYMWPKKDLSDSGCFHFLFKINFFCSDVGVWRKQGKCEVWSVKEAVGSEKCEVWSVKFKFGVRSAQCEVWGLECEGSSGKCEVWSVECEVSSSECEECSVKCGVWRLCFVSRWKNQTVVEVWSAKRAVWSVRFGVWRKQWEVRSVKCEVRSVKCEVWSVKFQVRSAKSAVWSVECEDFASSLAEKIKRLSREGHGRDRAPLNYRSFMFGKLPPPACPGLCYYYHLLSIWLSILLPIMRNFPLLPIQPLHFPTLHN